VVTKTSEIAGARWDIDKVSDDWLMEVLDDDELKIISKLHETDGSGTEIIWEKTDRLAEDERMDENSFNEIVSAAGKELSKIFHRFLQPDSGKQYSKIDIEVDGNILQAFDPFYSKHSATIGIQEEEITLNDGIIKIKPYIIPHYSHLSSVKYEELGGLEGFIKNQGFYVYRNRRLIIYGTWFKILKHAPLTNLVRIRVDIPNSIDSEWKISVDKSDLQIPSYLKKRLREVVEKNVNKKSRKVYKGRSKPLDQTGIEQIWNKSVSGDGKISYSINTNHTFIKWFIEKLDVEQSEFFTKVLLDLVSKNIPAPTIFFDVAENPKNVVGMTEEQIREMVRYLRIESEFAEMTDEEFESAFADIDPFASNIDIFKNAIRNCRNEH
jgi:hypothetical protein